MWEFLICLLLELITSPFSSNIFIHFLSPLACLLIHQDTWLMLFLALYCRTIQADSIPIKHPKFAFLLSCRIIFVYSISFSVNFLVTPHSHSTLPSIPFKSAWYNIMEEWWKNIYWQKNNQNCKTLAHTLDQKKQQFSISWKRQAFVKTVSQCYGISNNFKLKRQHTKSSDTLMLQNFQNLHFTISTQLQTLVQFQSVQTLSAYLYSFYQMFVCSQVQ